MKLRGVLLALLAVSTGLLAPGSPAAEPLDVSPEGRALAYLACEVPRWARENHCHSCHNNGDAARALYAGIQAGYAVPGSALTDTNLWLADPRRWEEEGGKGPFSDRRLARLQFTSTLAAARSTGQVSDPMSLIRAADRLAGEQAADGSWPLEGVEGPASAPTLGDFLAGYLARASLKLADPIRFRRPIEQSTRWLTAHPTRSVMEVSVSLLVAADADSKLSEEVRSRALDRLRTAQTVDGGWGPFASSPPENFDTSLALLALDQARRPLATRVMIARARAFLIARQQPDGSWSETTRPPGAVSYAQRVSTTAWATLGLLATRSGG